MTTGDRTQPVPPGTLLNTTPEEVTVDGIQVRQVSTKPLGDTCAYSVVVQTGAAKVVLEKIPV